MAPDFHENITVQPDGVKLGWNIMATLAAIGMGMYIYISVIPIKALLEQQAKDIAHMVQDDQVLKNEIRSLQDALNEKIHKCETQGAVLENRITTIESRNHLPNR